MPICFRYSFFRKIFQQEYNKHHEKSYASEQSAKREARLTEEDKAIRAIKNKKYNQQNKEKINKRARKRYAKNPDKYREYYRKYYESKKEIIAQARKIRSERS